MHLDPDVASIVLALGLAAGLTLVGAGKLRRAQRRAERFCAACGRRLIRGQRTCDCDG